MEKTLYVDIEIKDKISIYHALAQWTFLLPPCIPATAAYGTIISSGLQKKTTTVNRQNSVYLFVL